MTFTYQQLADHYGTSRTTFWRHLKKHEKEFTRTSTGDFFNETDALLIAKLLGFKIPLLEQKEPPVVSSSFKTSFK